MKYLQEWLLIAVVAAVFVVIHEMIVSDGFSMFSAVVEFILLLGFGAVVMELYRTNIMKAERDEVHELLYQFKHTLDLTLDCVFMFDPKSLQFTYVNNGAIHQVGYSEKELLRMTPLDIKPEFTEERFKTMIEKLVSGEEKHLKFETIHEHKNGRLIPVEIVLQYVLLNEGDSRFIAIVRDISERQQTQATLSQSQQSLQLFFDQSLDGIFFMMIDKPVVWNDSSDKEALLDYIFEHQQITKLNGAMARQYGYDPEAMMGRKPADFFVDNPEHGRKLWRQMLDAGRLTAVSEEQRADGTLMWVEGDYICLYDNEGRVTGHFGIQRDITVKKMALDELMESEKRLELSIESSEQGTWEWNIQSGQVLYGGKGAQLLGYEEGELNPSLQTWLELLHPNDRDRAQRLLKEYVQSGELYKTEYRLRCKDGSYKWVLSTGKVIDYDSQGQPLRMAGIHMDIDERKRNEQRLKLSIEGSNLGTWDWNIRTGEVIYGGKWAEMIGYSLDELKPDIGTWERLVYEEDKDRVKQVLEEHLHGDDRLYRVEFRMKMKQGGLRWVMAVGRVMEYDSEGEPIRMSGTHTDIDEMKRLQLELKELNANLEAKVDEAVHKQHEQEKILIRQSRMADMGEMIAEIAHQWRQPLNAIGLMMQLIQSRVREGKLTPESVDEMVTKGKKQLEFMSGTIDDFRNFFKPLKDAVRFNLAEAVTDISHIMLPQFQKSNIRFDVIFKDPEGAVMPPEQAGEDEHFFIHGYPNEFKQVLLNIIGNAKDAVEEQIRDSGDGFDGAVTMQVERGVDKTRITVADNGGGIAEDVIDRIFEPYFTTKPDERGTGIGLYMSKIIMERYMNGDIAVSNEKGGAKFVIEVKDEQ
jgi:PAS domain S-box-containing protein